MITHIFGSDEMYQRILDCSEGDHPFPSARVVGFASFHAGAGEIARAAWERHIPMVGLYGSSEVQALFSLQQPDRPLSERIEAGGLPANSDAAIRIRDIDTGGELLPSGRSGAIEIRADTNFVGYLNDPEASRKAFDKDGYFRTGDVGYLREDGTFVHQTRQGDAMRLGGYLVSPAEIEDVFRTFPGVADVQVVSVDIGHRQCPVAFVIPLSGFLLDEQEMLGAALRTLAAFKVPAHVWMIDSFPVTDGSNGTKIQRAMLRAMAIEKLAALNSGNPQ